MKDLKSILKKLDQIEENQMGQLQGGFASITLTVGGTQFSNTTNNCKGTHCPVTNNCHGGNCGPNCGIT